MFDDEDPTKIPKLTTLIMIAAGIICGSFYHYAYALATYDTGHSVQAWSIPLVMLGLGIWFISWTIRKPLLNWFPVAMAIFCFGFAGLLL